MEILVTDCRLCAFVLSDNNTKLKDGCQRGLVGEIYGSKPQHKSFFSNARTYTSINYSTSEGLFCIRKKPVSSPPPRHATV